ncbi:DUF3027 domain-containing protein [Nocardia puris]|uniref:DUF3027 domain-containing protein n=1 Tax=Nocardia puris TaxID=208602 RepID=UPI0018937BE6|nr:DUF3027 domain-containing protein [Nocardia puris]MBF6365731.1 DUF3027 domain-containing protein [Nocardia puris]MBF6460627.1 DUF3027 domain-containing protein [Nocardia puris]
MSAVSVSDPDVRPVLVEAAGLARRALLDLEPSGVGDHLGVSAEDESAATHRFAATLPGYRGWQWEVVVAAPPGADRATVSESALLPGPDALVAPDFVPWDQRVRPGDLSPGDLLATAPDDPRLVPGYVDNGDPEVAEVALEIGLGRSKVLSEEGRLEAAERWYSEFGPGTEMAKAAPATCGLCGFYLPLAGALRAAFGVCANAMGADGRVVHTEYGCGAHSDVEIPTGAGSPLYEAFDDAAFDVIPAEELRKSAEGAVEAAPAQGVSGSETGDVSSDTDEVPVAQVAEVDAASIASVRDAEVAADAETAAADVEHAETGESATESASFGQSDQPAADITPEPTGVEAAEASAVDAGAQNAAVAEEAVPADAEAVVAEDVSDEVGAAGEGSAESVADSPADAERSDASDRVVAQDESSESGADDASATGTEEASVEAENSDIEAERSESGSSSPN